MKFVISPAKSLNFESPVPTEKFTQGVFLPEAERLNGILKKEIQQVIVEIDAYFG